MKAKRIFAGLSALTLATTMLTVSAFASEAPELREIKPDDSGNPNPNPASTTVTYSVTPSYTVTIPTKVTLSDENDVKLENAVSASDVRLEKGKMIVVSLADSNDFKVKNGDESVTYKVSNTAGELANGDTVKEFTENGSEELTFAKINKDDVKYAGDYTGSLTFNIAVEEVPQSVLSGALVDGATIKVNFKWRMQELGDYVQGVYNASSGTFTVTKGGRYWGRDDRAVYKVEKSGDNIIIGVGYYGYDEEGMVWTFNTTDDTYTYTQGSDVSSRPDMYGLTSVTLNDTDITSQLTKN